MKRPGPPERKTALKAKATTAQEWAKRSRETARQKGYRGSTLPAESARRKREKPVRAQVRAEVLQRDGNRCRGRGILPGRCGSPFGDRPPLEVHEVIPRSLWAAGYLDPENCMTLCQLHHDWVTEHDTEARALGFSSGRTSTGVDGSAEGM